jgi:Tol biopolymer transport system component
VSRLADPIGWAIRLPRTGSRPTASRFAPPDGKRIAFGSDDGKDAIVWIYDLSGASSMRRLTLGGRNRVPVWSADGEHVR